MSLDEVNIRVNGKEKISEVEYGSEENIQNKTQRG